MLTMIANKDTFIHRLLSISLLLILHITTVRSGELISDNSIEFSGYSELYYTFDFTNPKILKKGISLLIIKEIIPFLLIF